MMHLMEIRVCWLAIKLTVSNVGWGTDKHSRDVTLPPQLLGTHIRIC
jgi:hypothetical protein